MIFFSPDFEFFFEKKSKGTKLGYFFAKILRTNIQEVSGFLIETIRKYKSNILR